MRVSATPFSEIWKKKRKDWKRLPCNAVRLRACDRPTIAIAARSKFRKMVRKEHGKELLNEICPPQTGATSDKWSFATGKRRRAESMESPTVCRRPNAAIDHCI